MLHHCSRSFDQGKITKSIERQSGLRKTRCFEKNNPHVFLNRIFCFFLKDTGFCSYPLSELFLLHHAIYTKSPFLNCFYCTMQYRHIQNCTIITCYTYYGIQIWGRRNVPHLCFRKVLLVNLLQTGKAWQEHAQQTEKSHSDTNCSFTSSLCTCSASSTSI